MSEFKIHHLVTELLELCGSQAPPEEFVETLLKSMSQQSQHADLSPIVLQNKVQSLANRSPNPELFLTKYEELKTKNAEELGPFVSMLHEISEDPNLAHFLAKTSKLKKGTSRKSKSAASEITKESLPEIRIRLLKAVKHPVSYGYGGGGGGVINESTNSQDRERERERSGGERAVPEVISWTEKRPYMSWDFNPRCDASLRDMGKVPVGSQEHVLIEDLLNVMVGLDGNCIEALPLGSDPNAPREFAVSDSVDVSLAELVKQILPLASCYSTLQRFVEQKVRLECGQVNNALCAAIRAMLVDYVVFVCQLESEFKGGTLNLHKLWFYVQQNMHSMALAASIVGSLSRSGARGARVLSLLHDHTVGYIGDAKAQKLCLGLTQAAAVPYMRMLEKWIYKGVISDPAREFLVEDSDESLPSSAAASAAASATSATVVDYSADYWAKRYTVRRERIPKFLERVADITLRAGKYLNVIQQCGKAVPNPPAPPERLTYRIEEKDYAEVIERSYLFASRTLLDLLMNENDLTGRLLSVKHYFLLDQGDFIVQFMNLSERELRKDVGRVLPARLESLLEIALRMSGANSDPYKEDMRAVLLPYDLRTQMLRILSIQTDEEQDYWTKDKGAPATGLDAFSFAYEVRWPVSLVLNRKALACYQMIFRHLFYCKYVEKLVCSVWRSNRVSNRYAFPSSALYRSAYSLRHCMLHFVQNLEYHMMVEVIEPAWNSFMQRVSKVNNVDEVLVCHSDFQDMCLKDCMLTSPMLLKTITTLLELAREYCEFMQQTQQHSAEAELGSLEEDHDCRQDLFYFESTRQLEMDKETLTDAKQMESFEQHIVKYRSKFNSLMLKLLDQINALGRDSNDRLFNLLYRLDYGYYTIETEKSETSMVDTSG